MTRTLRPSGKASLESFATELSTGKAPARSKHSRQDAPNSNIQKYRAIRRTELRKLVPLSDTTIYDMEKRGDFPKRFNLSPRCVVWKLSEVLEWMETRHQMSIDGEIERAPSPDVSLRCYRPKVN